MKQTNENENNVLDDLKEMHSEKETPKEVKVLLKAIKKKCLDCCCGLTSEVEKCSSKTCSIWTYRMGKYDV